MLFVSHHCFSLILNKHLMLHNSFVWQKFDRKGQKIRNAWNMQVTRDVPELNSLQKREVTVSGSFGEVKKIQYSLWAEDKQVVHTLEWALGKADFKPAHIVAHFLWRRETTNTIHCSQITLSAESLRLPFPCQSRGTSGIQPSRARRTWGRSHRTRGPSAFQDTDSQRCSWKTKMRPLCKDGPSCWAHAGKKEDCYNYSVLLFGHV